MKSRIYSIALAAVMSLVAINTATAQETPAPAMVPVAPVAPVAPIAPATRVYVTSPQAYVPYTAFGYGGESQDTAYRTKMRKLQEKMRALNKEMSDLNHDERVRTSIANQERVVALRRATSVRFDSTFSRNFARTMSSVGKIRFNFDNDANLQKQVASGEVKEKTKTFTKSYPIDKDDLLKIDNTYGKITVNTWAKNEFKVDVEIKSYANSDEDAQKLLDQTTIASSKDASTVSFKTTIERDNNSWWGTSSENGKITKVRKVIINYIVYMPSKSSLTLANRFGNTILPVLDGKLNINNSYGKLDAKALTNRDNVINLRYVDANFANLNGSDLNAAYGTINLDIADNLTAKLSYSPTKIGKLNTAGNIDLRYGEGLVITDVDRNIKSLTINSNYAPIKISSLNDINADFDVSVRYMNFIYDNGGAVNVVTKTPADGDRGYSTTKTYKGHIGKGNADKLISVKSSYADVKFD
jgi:hypothetical protein